MQFCYLFIKVLKHLEKLLNHQKTVALVHTPDYYRMELGFLFFNPGDNIET